MKKKFLIIEWHRSNKYTGVFKYTILTKGNKRNNYKVYKVIPGDDSLVGKYINDITGIFYTLKEMKKYDLYKTHRFVSETQLIAEFPGLFFE